MQEQVLTIVSKPFYKKWTFWGILIVLGLYGCIIGFYTYKAFHAPGENRLLNSNELGDFLAGVFAPLAFLFLYLGYLQQGEALRKSNDHLSEQLKQQNRLIALQEAERIEREHAAQPIFDLVVNVSPSPEFKYDEKLKRAVMVPNTMGQALDIKIKNSGQKISTIIISISGDVDRFVNSYILMDTNEEASEYLVISKEQLDSINKSVLNLRLDIIYKTSLGSKYLKSYPIVLNLENNTTSYAMDVDHSKID